MSLIARLKGVALERGPDWLLVDVGGIGLRVYGASGTLAQARPGAQVTLHTHLIVREDDMILYGFSDAEEQRFFEILIAVNGVGPKAALAMLSVMAVKELTYAIASGNAAALARAPGVGPKLAGRIVLDLRDKLVAGVPAALPGKESEVVSALVGLGYSQTEALEAVGKSELPSDSPVEERVRLALGYFARE